MIPLFLLLGLVMGLCRLHATTLRFALGLTVLLACALAWGVHVAVHDEAIDWLGVWLAGANAAAGWATVAAVIGLGSAVATFSGEHRME